MISADDRELARLFGRAIAADIKADQVEGRSAAKVLALVPKKPAARPKLRMAKASLRSTTGVKREA